jgi:molybdopterin molybdotransferase
MMPAMSTPVETASVLAFEEARHVVENEARKIHPTTIEVVDLLNARGHALAQEVHADRDLPPFNRAARDGYAVRSTHVTRTPVSLKIVAEIAAGGKFLKRPLGPGEAAAIMTGAALPEGSDAVAMLEHTVRRGDTVEIHRPVSAGENFVPRGAEANQGDLLLTRGIRMNHAAVAVAATVGLTQIKVHARPRVALVATGDEVVSVNADPEPTQIRNSNSYSLAAQVEAAGGTPVLLPVAPDKREQLRNLIAEGLGSDLLLLSGGVSVGKYDFVEQILHDFDARFFFTGALIQPGRPVVFGRAQRQPSTEPTYFLGLPGNPISTMVTFELFARPIIDALSGAAPEPLRFLQARLKSDVSTRPGLKRFLPARLSGEFDQTEVELIPWQGSADVVSAARADCYLVVPPDRPHLRAGELVAVLLR